MKQSDTLKTARRPATLAPGARGGSGTLAAHVLLLCLFALIVVAVNPRGYAGGGWDDGRYLAAMVAWAEHGPVLGANHWSLRWPLVLPGAALIRLFGLDQFVLMIPGIAAWLGLALVNYWGLRRAAGERAAFIGALWILANPNLTYFATLLYPDCVEAMLWSAALWSIWFAGQARDAREQTRFMIAAGLATGIAVGIRETALALVVVTALAAWYMRVLPRRAWLVWLAAAAPLPLIEHLSLWIASGDPLYRIHVDLNHIRIPSENMRGGVALDQSAPFNPEVMERWSGAGPVHLHWLVDPWINFFVNLGFGLSFVGAALLGWLLYRRGGAGAGPAAAGAELVRPLLIVAGANILVNIYVLALDPASRIFVPATTAMSVLTAILAARLWSPRIRGLIIGALVVKMLAGLVAADVAPDFGRSAAPAERIAPAAGPIHVDWRTNAHLALASPSLRRRFLLSEAPVGGHALQVIWPSDGEPAPSERWQVIADEPVGHRPWTVRLLAPPIQAAGFMRDFVYPDVRVRLVRRVAE